MAEQTRWIYAFAPGRAEGTLEMKHILGGKGASLAHMSSQELPVPPGFTISAECCAYYYSHHQSWPPGLAAELKQHLKWLEETTGRQYAKGPRPLLVSVRSGAAISMPGMMDTVLNVGLHPGLESEMQEPVLFWTAYHEFIASFGSIVAGVPAEVFENLEQELRSNFGRSPDEELSAEEAKQVAARLLSAYEEQTGEAFPTDPEVLLHRAIDAVFDSWSGERAVKYRQHHDIRNLAGTAVNVQSMFPSEVSGVLFTVNPNTGNTSEMIVEASRGLGEAVVSGRVSPDIYVLDRETLTTKESPVTEGKGPGCLPEKYLQELGKLSLKVEQLFGHPADIEWGLAEGKLALLQARRIAGLEVVLDLESARQQEITKLKAWATDRTRVWCVHNLGETLSAPRPLTWDIVAHFMSGIGGFGEMYKELGYIPSSDIDRRGFLDLIGGQVYADLTRAPQLFFDRFPLEYDLTGAPEGLVDALDSPPRKMDFSGAGPRFFLRLPYYVYKMVSSQRRIKKLLPLCLDKLQDEILPPFLSYVRETRELDLDKLSETVLLEELDARIDRVMTKFGKESLKPTFFAALTYGLVENNLCAVLGEEKGKTIARQLMTGLGADKTLEASIALYEVAQEKRSLESFLDEYGHRAVNELELAQPRWREDTDYLQRMTESYRTSSSRAPVELHQQQREQRQELEAKLPEMLSCEGGASLVNELQQNLKRAQSYMPWRETGKHYLMMGYELIRQVLQELARRWDLGSDIYFLRRGELARFLEGAHKLKDDITRRKVRWQALQRSTFPEVIRSDELEALEHPTEIKTEGRELEGVALASGSATGIAELLKNPHEARQMDDYVIVCPSTDPGWTPLFVRAVGLVVERGGMLSHGAVVARDFGIPAVRITNALQRIPDGAKLRVDGNAGKVYLL